MTRQPIRLIVTTDPELDDLNSMLRLLLYANELDLVALVVSSSRYHWAGDPERSIAPHRWPPADAPSHIEQAIDAYAEVHANLVAHDPRYPDPATLRSRYRIGNIATEGDTAAPSPGSDLIAEILLDDEPGVVVAQAWGGFNTIARALLSVEADARARGDWPEVRDRVTARTILTSFAEQDDTFARLIRPSWPEMELRQVATLAWCYPARAVVDAAHHRYLDADWTRTNVSEVGPLGAAYRVWGDGLQMAEGFDAEDYFGLRDLDGDELRARGYEVFVPPEPPGSWISEGDSSNFALHIDNGLRNFEDPTWGGWGGRQAPDPDDPHAFVSVGFGPIEAAPTDWGDVGRWLPALQNDFAARLRWTVAAPADANHAPTLTVEGDLDRIASPGSTLTVAWATSDPDGDRVTVTPWIYAEAGTVDGATLEVGDARVTVAVPATARAGQTLHLILEAIDDGEPPMTRYARVVVTVS